MATTRKTKQSTKTTKANRATKIASQKTTASVAAKRTKSRPKFTAWSYIWRFVVSLAIPLGVGGLSALIAGDAMSAFGDFNQPPLAPPAWLFPVAWTILYILMGVAFFLVWIHPTDLQITKGEKAFFFIVYGIQLAFNFAWSIFFFNLGWHWFTFFWLIMLWTMILGLVIWGVKNHRAVMWLLLPYLLWVTFAGYLNLMIAILN